MKEIDWTLYSSTNGKFDTSNLIIDQENLNGIKREQHLALDLEERETVGKRNHDVKKEIMLFEEVMKNVFSKNKVTKPIQKKLIRG